MSRSLCLQLENEALVRRNAMLQRQLSASLSSLGSSRHAAQCEGNRMFELESRLARAESTIIALESALQQTQAKLARAEAAAARRSD